MKKFWLIIFICLALVACEDEPGTTVQPQPRPKQTDAEDPGVLYKKLWLSVADEAAPEVWLAAKAEQTDHPQSRTIAEFRELLLKLDAKFHDGPRMIANRAVQLETMLAEQKIEERFPQILEGFGKLAEGHIRPGFFAEVCAQYFTLRKNGKGRDEALAELASVWRNPS